MTQSMAIVGSILGPSYHTRDSKVELQLQNSDPKEIGKFQGRTVIEQTETISGTGAIECMKTLVTAALILKAVIDHGPKLVCPTVTLWTGLQNLASGGVISGTFLTGAGLWGLYQAYQDIQQNPGAIKETLDNAKDLMTMVSVLAEHNDDAAKNILTHLNMIDDSIQSVTGRIKTIQKTTAEGLEDIQKQKARCEVEYANAQTLYAQSKQCFEKAQQCNNEAGDHYLVVADRLSALLTLLQSKEGTLEERNNQLIQLVQDMQKDLITSKKQLDESNAALVQGLKLYEQMNEVTQQVSGEMARLMTMVEDKMKYIESEVGHMEAECETIKARKELIKSHAEDIRANSGDQKLLLEQGEKQINKAQKMVQQLERTCSALFGLGTAVTTYAVVSSNPVFIASTGLLAAYAYHRGDTVKELLTDFAFGKAEAPCPEPTIEEPVQVALFNRSTGLGGCLLGRESHTAGVVKIHTGKGSPDFVGTFNLNEFDPISPTYAKLLLQFLQTSLKEGRLSPSQCLKVIAHIKEKHIEGKIGLVTSPVFNHLERYCKTQLQSTVHYSLEKQKKVLEEQEKRIGQAKSSRLQQFQTLQGLAHQWQHGIAIKA